MPIKLAAKNFILFPNPAKPSPTLAAVTLVFCSSLLNLLVLTVVLSISASLDLKALSTRDIRVSSLFRNSIFPPNLKSRLNFLLSMIIGRLHLRINYKSSFLLYLL
jgi:hypothetical protein